MSSKSQWHYLLDSERSYSQIIKHRSDLFIWHSGFRHSVEIADIFLHSMDTHTLPNTHTHTPPQTIPCGYLDVLSIRKWKWEREQIKALCHLRCLVHAVRFFLAAELIWGVNRFTDGEIVGPQEDTSRTLFAGVTCALPCRRGVHASVVVATYCCYLNPEITSAQPGLFSCCSHGRMGKLYQRLSSTYFPTLWPATD